MNYWITTHWPPHDEEFVGPVYCGVWLQNGKQGVAAVMKPGDLVFKYESRSGPSRVVERSGKTVTQACHHGRMGIVALMEVRGDLQDLKNTPQEYEGGSEKWWRYYAECGCKDADGFVSLATLNPILGFSPRNNMRGFGDAHSGLKRINLDTFLEIYAAFKQVQKSV